MESEITKELLVATNIAWFVFANFLAVYIVKYANSDKNSK